MSILIDICFLYKGPKVETVFKILTLAKSEPNSWALDFAHTGKEVVFFTTFI